MEIWDGPEFRPDRGLRAFDPSFRKACAKDSGYANAFLKTLGRDCSGLANPAIEHTRRFEADLEHTRMSNEFRRGRVEEILREVKAKRRVH